MPLRIETLDAGEWKEHSAQHSEYRDARCMIDGLLETHSRVRLVALSTEVHSSVGPDVYLYFGAFTDPARGRIKFSCASDAELIQEELKRREACKAQVFTPAELYALSPLNGVSCRMYSALTSWLEDYLHEFDIDIYSLAEAAEASGRLVVKTLVDVQMDSDEHWALSTLWFDDRPFAIVQEWYEDQHECRVTDHTVLDEIRAWLRSFQSKPAAVAMDQPDATLTEFWGYKLTDFYDVQHQESIRCPECNGYWPAPLGVGPMNRLPRKRCQNSFHSQPPKRTS